MTQEHTIIVGDIGGTHSRFGAFEVAPADRQLRLMRTVWFKTADATSFDELLETVTAGNLREFAGRARTFVFAVAGPVVEGTSARLPNVAWPVDISEMRRQHGHDRVLLINDFAAQAFATKTAIVADAQRIKPGTPEARGLVAVIGAGTGLGHCSILTTPAGELVAVPSEAGHQDFAFAPDEREFEGFAREALKVQTVTADLIVCGRGLALLHRFHTGQDLSPAEAAAKLTPDSPVLEGFACFYGRACRHYAMAVLPTGGIYVSGGVAARNPIVVTHAAFADEFLRSSKHRPLLERIPIWLNAQQESGLWGAALFGALSIR